jgi:hypothetical protein
MARRLGDPTTLQRVVALPYFSICVPETLDERLAMTAEALASAAAQTDPVVLHWVHRWRLYACANAGDIEAIDALLPEVVRAASVGLPGLFTHALCRTCIDKARR